MVGEREWAKAVSLLFSCCEIGGSHPLACDQIITWKQGKSEGKVVPDVNGFLMGRGYMCYTMHYASGPSFAVFEIRFCFQALSSSFSLLPSPSSASLLTGAAAVSAPLLADQQNQGRELH